MLYIGVNYHPHDWTEEQWEKDVRLMKEAGFTTVRLGHLCWDSYEPENGVYRFEWFDRVMDLFAEAGIGVVLDLSMHPAPLWVHRECPGCRIVSPEGNVQAPLTRYMEDVADEDYQRYALRFARKLAERYRDHPALFAFGLCNEQGAGWPSYSEASRRRFIRWLEEKYITVEALNEAWATRRWSRRLTGFEDVFLQENALTKGSPEAWLDMKRFFSDGIAGFMKKLREIAEQAAPGIPHSSNHYAEHGRLGFDYLKAWPDFVGYPGIGFYPGYENRASDSFAVTTAWYMARLTETARPMWCLEFVTGGFGIQGYSEGVLRMYAFWCLLHRAQMILGWTYRTMTNGEEQFLYGLLNHDGFPNENYHEFARIAADFRKLGSYGFPYLPKPRIAVADSYDSKMFGSYHPGQFRQGQIMQLARTCRCLEKMNLDYNIIDLRKPAGDYDLLIIPGHFVMDEVSAAHVREAVREGMRVIMTAGSAFADEHGKVFSDGIPGGLTELFGLRVRGFSRTQGVELPEKAESQLSRNAAGKEVIHVDFGGERLALDVDYLEKLELCGAEPLAAEARRGYCAAAENRFGKGKVCYLFTEADDVLLYRAIEKYVKEAGIPVLQDVPGGVCARVIAPGQVFFLNLSNRDLEIRLDQPGSGVLREKRYEDVLPLPAFDGELLVTE